MNTLNKFLISTLILAGLSLHLAEAAAPAPLPRTGQTPTTPLNPAPIGADGALEKGVAWPSPRFIDNADGTVTDALTDLVWLKNANCTDTVGGVSKTSATLKWSLALSWSNALASGKCGLSDGSAAGDWRLPNRRELESLVDLSQTGPALPADHPFTAVWSSNYWSSSTVALATGQAWILNFSFGDPGRLGKASRQFVWPVRDASAKPSIKIGDTYQGGIVFYIDGSGQHGLIAAPSDQSAHIQWYYAVSLADSLELNGYSDWFLPGKDALNLMYKNIGPGAPAPLTNIGGFSPVVYWSSSGIGEDLAWAQHFADGSQSDYCKACGASVRAARAF